MGEETTRMKEGSKNQRRFWEKTNNKTYCEMSRGEIEQIKLINSCNDGGEFGEEKKLDKRNLGISTKKGERRKLRWGMIPARGHGIK
jgi:hypothetical protein